MGSCRVCLSKPADIDMFQQKTSQVDGGKSYSGIFQFCLDIKVIKDSNITSKLCWKCCQILLQFYKFKTLALQNDDYLNSMPPIGENSELGKEEVLILFGTEETDNVDDAKEVDTTQEVSNAEQSIHVAIQCYLKDSEAETNCLKSELDGDEYTELESDHDSKITECEVHEVKCEDLSQTEIVERKQTPELINDSGPSHTTPITKEVKQIKQKVPKYYPCDLCPQYFKSSYMMRRHRLRKHILGPRRKRHCDICVKDYKDLEQHTALCHDRSKLQYACKKCNRRFFTACDREGHLCRDPKEYPYDCTHCDKRYKTRRSRRQHIAINHKLKRYQCDDCSKWFSVKSLMTKHIKMQHLAKNFKCSDCSTSFAFKSNLVVHQFMHTDQRIPCDKCDQTFKRPGELNRHIRKIHSRVYPCTFCDRICVTQTKLIEHIQMSHPQTTHHKCETCDKIFADSSKFEIHQNTHTQTTPDAELKFKCTECDKKLSTAMTLDLHVRRIHQQEKRCMCHICPMSFFRTYDLIDHIKKMHNNESPMESPKSKEDNGEFNSVWTMNSNHRHSIRLIICHICSKQFSNQSSLRTHIKEFHEKNIDHDHDYNEHRTHISWK